MININKPYFVGRLFILNLEIHNINKKCFTVNNNKKNIFHYQMQINKVIIWGHTLHDHTHSYIHNAFYRTFKYMGYETYWFSTDGENNYLAQGTPNNFENTLFIVHGIVSHKLPLNDTSIYIAHNVEFIGTDKKFPKNHEIRDKEELKGIPVSNIIQLQVYTKNAETQSSEGCSRKNTYYIKPPHSTIFMPWATDLLPEEINKNIINLEKFKVKNVSNFIGMPLAHHAKFRDELKKYNVVYRNYGGTFNKNSYLNKTVEENMKLIQESIIAPALQTQWQIDNGYIPCRIFKNISYGKMGITNNPTVNLLFDTKLIYSDNIAELTKMGLDFEVNNPNKNQVVKELMEYVRDNHTYINRINCILEYIKKYINITIG